MTVGIPTHGTYPIAKLNAQSLERIGQFFRPTQSIGVRVAMYRLILDAAGYNFRPRVKSSSMLESICQIERFVLHGSVHGMFHSPCHPPPLIMTFKPIV